MYKGSNKPTLDLWEIEYWMNFMVYFCVTFEDRTKKKTKEHQLMKTDK